MRIGVVVMSAYSSDPRVRREVRALTAAGDEVEVFSAAEDDRPAVLDGARVTPLGVPAQAFSGPIGYVFSYLRFVLVSARRLTVAHLRQPFDVIVVHTMPDFLVFAAVVPKLTGAPVVLDVHDLMPELYATKFGVRLRHPLVRLVTLAERLSVAFADQAIAVHDLHLRVLVGHGNPRDKFKVFLNLPDPDVFPPRSALPTGERRRPVRAIYHGTIERRHGLDVAIRAVASLRGNEPPIELAIIGAGDDVPRLRRLVSELGAGDSVVIEEGLRPVDELLPLLLDADIGVVPVIADDFTRYMLPTKLLEYIQLGIPAVVTDLPAVRDYLGDDQVCFVESGNVEDLAKRLSELAADPSGRRALAEAALRFADEHNWNAERRRFVEAVHGTRPRPRRLFVGRDRRRRQKEQS